MGDLLTPLKTVLTSKQNLPEQYLIEASHLKQPTRSQDDVINSTGDALEALRSKPSLDLLTRVLQFLDPSKANNEGFNIKIPGPRAAQLIFVLVSDTLPDYWGLLASPTYARVQNLLLRSLKSVSGIGAIIAHLRLCLDAETGSKSEENPKLNETPKTLEDLLDALESLLRKDNFVLNICNDIAAFNLKPSQRNLLWKEFVSFVGGGRILSLAAEAHQYLRQQGSEIEKPCWLGSGKQYSTWLGRNLIHMLTDSKKENVEDLKQLAQLLGKALSLGYTDIIVGITCSTLMHGRDHLLVQISSVIQYLSHHEQISFLYSVLRVLSKQPQFITADSVHRSEKQEENKTVNAGAAILFGIIRDSVALTNGLMEWVIGSSGDGFAHNVLMHRAGIAALSRDNDRMKTVLNRSLELFGDKLFIKHTPLLHQEVNTQVLLIVAGYVHRSDPQKLAELARSSTYLNAISNRLAASLPRSTVLGMIFGTAISELVDPKERRMNFDAEEVNSAEGQWHRNLTRLEDTIGLISDIETASSISQKKYPSAKAKIDIVTPSKAVVHPKSNSKIISIEEVESGSGSEEDNLPVYEKPDSDASDSEEDATLVRRDKPSAPVYIRDLVAGLRDTENHDRHKLALATASSLIRRKISFGTEVSEHLEDLATLLVGLNDKYEIERFQEMRLQGMIAVLLAEPLQMGQWFSRTYYNGDYSISQRATILTTLGLGARELAGFAKEDATLTGAPAVSEKPFPSKRLSEKLQQVYALDSSSAVTALSHTLEKSMLQPMAIEAADRISGPNVLKVRTFSSRMAVEKKRQKPIPNALAKVLANGFFLPLTGLWRIHLQTYGTTHPITSAPLLPLLLRTLSLLLHAAGPSTLPLPALTADFWALLLSLRARALTDPTVLEAILFSFLVLLTVNANNRRRVAEENAKELLETREWVQNVMELGGRGGGAVEEKSRMLGAGVLVEVEEVVKAWQRVMVGELGGFL